MNLGHVLSASAAVCAAGVAAAEPAEPACKAPVLVPAKTQLVTEQVLDIPERVTVRIQPAAFETVTEQVLVKETISDDTIDQAVREVTTERIEILPERTGIVVHPAIYETYSERVLVQPAGIRWVVAASEGGCEGSRLADKELGRLAQDMGLCPVEVPAEYETGMRTRLVRPERTETRLLPAEYITVEKERTRMTPDAAAAAGPDIYITVLRKQIVQPAQEELLTVPASYRTIERRQVVEDSRIEHRAVLCQDKQTSEKIAEIQAALARKGWKVELSGEFDLETRRAMLGYQQAEGLALGGLTAETLRALDVGLSGPAD